MHGAERLSRGPNDSLMAVCAFERSQSSGQRSANKTVWQTVFYLLAAFHDEGTMIQAIRRRSLHKANVQCVQTETKSRSGD